MSNPDNLAGQAAAAVMEPPPSPQIAEDPRRQTYWAIVGRSYWRSVISRIATVWAVAVMLLAALVPFVANAAPITAIIDGKREWPLFRDLTAVDLIWLVWLFATIVFLIASRILTKRFLEIESLRAARTKSLLIIVAIAVLATLFIASLKTDYLDSRDYHQLARDGQLQSALYVPWRWGYTDQEPLELDRLFEFPTKDHWLGTDGNGRDAMARLAWGARVVFEIGFVSELIAAAIGILYGALMGYFVGKVDLLGMQRLSEIVESIPRLFLLITFVAMFGRNLFMLMVILGCVGWTDIARFVRGEFLKIRQLDYVAAARALGLPLRSILFKHMLPNGLTPVIVTFTFGVAEGTSSANPSSPSSASASNRRPPVGAPCSTKPATPPWCSAGGWPSPPAS